MTRDGRVLLLDVMSTLVHDPFYVEMPEHFGMTLDELIAAKHPTAWIDFELDRIDEDTFFRSFFEDGRTFDGPAMAAAMKRAYRFVDGIEPLLQRLVATGVQMHTLSNYPRWYEMIESQLSLSRYMPWTFVSCRLGVRKPHPDAYLVPARRLGRSPSELVFVDDSQRNCDAAAELGLHAIRFETAEKLACDLEAIGLLPTWVTGRPG